MSATEAAWDDPVLLRQLANMDTAARLHETTRPPSRVDESGPKLFERWSPAELLDQDLTFHWLLQGVLARPTYGQISGERKTMKSYVATVLGLSLAGGVPAFGTFKVPEAMPVLAYVGEGGRIPYTRRLQRIASAVGVDLRSVPYVVSFDTAAIPSERFQQSLTRDLAEVQPGLVQLDPLYAYHGLETRSSDLHQEGSLLTSISTPCMAAGASLMINNHHNKTGTGNDLGRITQSGSGEWVDSWLLLSHRTDPDVASGRFWLRMDIGSRQWGGMTWDLDMSLGRFDPELGEFVGEISWEIRRSSASSNGSGEVSHCQEILDLLELNPWRYTRAQVLKEVGGHSATVRAVFDVLAQSHEIVAQKTPGPDCNGRDITRPRYALAPALSLEPGHGWGHGSIRPVQP